MAATSGQVVGWPPIRTYRINSMVNQAKTLLATEDPNAEIRQDVNKNRNDATKTRNLMFVKVTMDGIPIERKIDLSAHECYESLSNALEDMFLKSKTDDGRSGTFMIGNEEFPASLLDLPAVVEFFKTYDDCALVKTADIGQMIMVREPGDPSPNAVEYRHGLTPPMKDARKRRFRREPDLNPELVQRVERDLLKILSGKTVENVGLEQEEAIVKENKNMNTNANKKVSSSSTTPPLENREALETNENTNHPTEVEPERSESDDSDDSM